MQYSIINFSEAKKEKRFDAEFYLPKYKIAFNKIKNYNWKYLRELIFSLGDYHSNGSYETLRNHVELLNYKSYAYYLRTKELENNDFENDVLYVSESAYNFLEKSKLKGFEIAINKVGSPGNVYQVPNLNIPMTLGMNLFSIVPVNNINCHYLYIYLSSYYGQLFLHQRVTGAVPPSIDKESVRKVPVPIFSDEFQKSIEKLVLEAHNQRQISNSLMKEANEILEKEIGFDKLEIKKKKVNYSIVNYSETLSSKRIDAEYYQEKYQIIMDKIQSYKNGYDILDNICFIKKGIEPGSEYYRDNGIPFLRIQNLTKYDLKLDNCIYVDNDFYNKNAEYRVDKDDILLSKDGSPGIAYHIYNLNNLSMITSGGILRLKIKDNTFLPEVLALILNSKVVDYQVKQASGGAVILHWRMEEIFNTVIPIIDKNVQNIIAEKVQEFYKARDSAKALLEEAKKKVEDAIENGER